MNTTVKFLLHRYHYPIVGLIIAIAIALLVRLYHNGEDWKVFLPAIGAAISLVYIIEKQQLDEALLFKDIFSDFNARYDCLNDELNKISNSNGKLTDSQIACLNDYFNLCGEEYLYYRIGYIYPEVWKSWVLGMKIYYDQPRIRERWDCDLTSGSYYGPNIEAEIRRFAR
jgi:hypothetical protein